MRNILLSFVLSLFWRTHSNYKLNPNWDIHNLFLHFVVGFGFLWVFIDTGLGRLKLTSVRWLALLILIFISLHPIVFQWPKNYSYRCLFFRISMDILCVFITPNFVLYFMLFSWSRGHFTGFHILFLKNVSITLIAYTSYLLLYQTFLKR